MSIKDMSKDDLELLSHKDITNILLEEKGAMNTKDLFKTITELLELPSRVFETKIGDYYTTLTTDKRFVLLEDGKWDLRDKHTSSKLVVDDEDEDDADELELQEENDEMNDLDEESNFDDATNDDEFDELS